MSTLLVVFLASDTNILSKSLFVGGTWCLRDRVCCLQHKFTINIVKEQIIDR